MLGAEWASGAFLAHSLSGQAIRLNVFLGALGAHLLFLAGLSAALLLVRFSDRIPGPGTVRMKRVVVSALLGFPAAFWFGSALSNGEWIAVQPFAWAVRWGVALGLSGLSALLPWLVERGFGRLWFHALCLFSAVLLSVANTIVLPGLYIEAHLVLYAASLGLALLGTSVSAQPSFGRSVPLQMSCAVAALLVLGAFPFTFAEARAKIVRSSAGAGSLFAVALPPLGSNHLERELLRTPAHESRAAAPRGRAAPRPLGKPVRSVLFVVVDTLRADTLPPVRNGDEPFSKAYETPVLNRWFKKSYRFSNAYSQASQTKRSLPPTFRSLEPFENPERYGMALGHFARSLGLEPVAVVPQYFLMPAQPHSQALLEGFAQVEVFEKNRQETMLPQARRLLQGLKQTPFFAWVHFYNMHSPYFTGRPAPEKKLAAADEYGQALEWLDRSFGELLQILEELELSEDTLVVFAADHGEQLGEGKRYGHGSGLTEEEVHVPLAMYVPGAPGGVVQALTGNIDILPTMVELLGKPLQQNHRGDSLVPDLAELPMTTERARFLVSGNECLFGLVTQQHKLLYSKQLGDFSLFSRVSDPGDRHDLLGSDPLLDGELISEFVRKDPGLFKKELEKEGVRALVIEQLRQLEVTRPTEKLDFLLKLAASAGNDKVQDEALAVFERTNNLEVKLLVSQQLGEVDAKGWTKRWEDTLLQHQGTQTELQLVRALQSQAYISHRSRVAERRLAALADRDAGPLLDAWLALIESWPDKSARYLPPLLAIAERAALDPVTTERWASALGNVATLHRRAFRKGEDEVLARLEDNALSALLADEIALCVKAAAALGVVALERGQNELREVLHGQRDPRLRQAALHALVRRTGTGALDDLLRVGDDPLLTADTIILLKKLGSRRALPFLNRVAAHHYNSWTRGQAKDAAAFIQRKKR